MKIGEIKRDIDIKTGTQKNLFGIYTNMSMLKEGERILASHPQYEYLKNDPMLRLSNDDDELLKSVVYAYIKDEILKNNPALQPYYDLVIKKYRENTINTSGHPYSQENYYFLMNYNDYLRDIRNPGILEQERKQKEKEKEKERKQYEAEQAALKEQQEMRRFHEQQQLKRDLVSGTRVICPYCKSADTKKISIASRAVSVSLVGAASGKIGKQWHCNHCGSDF